MILDSITLHDFGVYAGRQHIELTPPSRDRTIVLVGGLNGEGKTTLLDAIQLVLFGEHAHTSNRGSRPYLEYLGRSIHKGSPYREASLSLTFRHFAEGSEVRYCINRSWRFMGRSVKERFQVTRNGVIDYHAATDWTARVQSLIPYNIAHLFLFNGEQIEAYADPKQASGLIEAAILNLLGLDIVDRLENDLKIFERQRRAQDKDGSDKEKIKHFEEEAERARRRLSHLRQDAAAIETRLARWRQDAEQLEQEFQAAGGVLYEQSKELEQSLEEARERLDEREAELRELAAGAFPLLLVERLLGDAVELASEEAAAEDADKILSVLEERDANILALLGGRKGTATATALLQSFLAEDRAARVPATEQPLKLGLQPDTHVRLSALRTSILKETSRATLALERYSDGRSAVTSIEERLSHLPDEDSISPLIESRRRIRGELAGLENQKERKQMEIDAATKEFQRLENMLAGLLEADAKARLGRHERGRMVAHSFKARGTLREFRQRIIERNVARIERLILESYQQLLRKTSLVERVVVDSRMFAMSLFAPDGHRIELGRLSAGERQLLAVAILWGLAKASGRVLPTAIDTPLGRLDGAHRENLVRRYFPNASHQVLLLSTDKEITGEHLQSLEPWIGHRYRLHYHDRTRSTTVSPGYFDFELQGAA